MYNVILCAISLLGTKHINHEFEFAVTKDLCIIQITHVTQLSNCYCNALNRTIIMIVYIQIDLLINVINVLIPIIIC